ncbi:cAMP-binding domain of CRP or a regulatory subunit of cAMP-dependent protein kinases [Mucilaginibacter lappiensis]|uniref:CRP-like cAMP-binding protein n=1 Tax=Mucilaginibacter lappiensis TaxID=354630 RepID=A0ABR6PIJ6_9SPHI|nr:Crp/Fnr family transcriptional regulator [Mucilaginibacter lappiensis]MBB6109587.1 CRP-like cAMP-binding protein [Mucilaginibacter lappiensis]SIR08493.1 cAMP-binding domain of CRP or a regulatory subunit of cAMP-dependent protein kinases [Mucilaginibacter lappiensis]
MHPALQKQIEGKIVLTAEQEQLVSSCYKPRLTKRGEILLEKGSVARYLFFVVKGCLRVFLTKEDGSEWTRFLIFEDHFGTAFPSFVQQKPSVAAIQSMEASELFMISRQDSQMLLREIPGWETMIRLGLEQDYIASIERIESLITLDAKERYNILMKTQPGLIQRLPSKIIADYLGISQETLSRLKSKK